MDVVFVEFFTVFRVIEGVAAEIASEFRGDYSIHPSVVPIVIVTEPKCTPVHLPVFKLFNKKFE